MDPNHTWPKCIGQNIDNREDTTDDTEGKTRNWGGRRGLINVRGHCRLNPSDPSPFPATVPPNLLSLQTTTPWKSGMKESK